MFTLHLIFPLMPFVFVTVTPRYLNVSTFPVDNLAIIITFCFASRRAGSDGSMSASGSAGPGFYPRRGCKFSFENFRPRG